MKQYCFIVIMVLFGIAYSIPTIHCCSVRFQEEFEEDICSICYTALADKPMIQLGCSSHVPHIFHEKCIARWFRTRRRLGQQAVCPLDNSAIDYNHNQYIDYDNLLSKTHLAGMVAGIVNMLCIYYGCTELKVSFCYSHERMLFMFFCFNLLLYAIQYIYNNRHTTNIIGKTTQFGTGQIIGILYSIYGYMLYQQCQHLAIASQP